MFPFTAKEVWIMMFDDFKNREWKVLPGAEPSAKHSEGDVVSFDGEAGKVNVRCKRYGDGQYKEPEGGEKEGRIEGDGYTISMTTGPDGKLQIQFTPKEGLGPIGGSWTAEDIGSGAGDGE
jgi:hypothetical protein